MSSNISPTLSSNNIRIYEEEDLSVYEIQRGSRLRIDRGAFSHWEVFIGQGRVVHMGQIGQNGSSPSMGTGNGNGRNGFIREESFTDMMSNYGDEIPSVYVDNSSDSYWTPLSPDEIVRRARSRRGYTNYALTTENCEHFVNWCRYDKWESRQVNNVQTGIAVAAALIFRI